MLSLLGVQFLYYENQKENSLFDEKAVITKIIIPIDPTSDSTSKNIREFADAFQLKGWFYGHAHDNESIDDRKIGENKVLVSRSQSLMLENGQHCEGYQPETSKSNRRTLWRAFF